MTEKEIIKALRQMGNEPRYQAITKDQLEAGRQRLMFGIGMDPKQPPRQYGWRENVQLVWLRFRDNALRPLAIGATAFVFMIGGWAGMVNASFDTVPGDALYPVKIANERAQLAMALSGEKKVKLHIEFASRRLDEVVTLTSVSGEEAQVKVAIDSFTKEIEAVSQQIDEIKADNMNSASEMAKIVDRKIDEYQVVINQSGSDFSEENQADVLVAQEAVDSAGSQAVEVLVENHETEQAEATANDLEKAFQKDLANINARLAVNESRIDNILSVLADQLLTNKADYQTSLKGASSALLDIRPVLNEALNLMAAGGYRKAFESLQVADDALVEVETALTSLEIVISTEIADQLAEVEEVIIEDDELTPAL